ncbi:MAG: DUF255 domain-containing protein [Cytophagales bacterium]|nr:MAG: DUF255 domain-containing protein [Cytophagales bacterium]
MIQKSVFSKIALGLMLLQFLSLTVFAQILTPAKWSVSSSVQEAKIGDEINIIFNVSLQKNWYLYSTDFDPDLGPQITEFQFKANPSYELIGKIQPIGSKKKFDEVWQGDITYFTEKAQFVQKVKIKSTNPIIEGSYSYQVCSDKDGKCIPFEDDFKISNLAIKASEEKKEEKEEKKETRKDTTEATEKQDSTTTDTQKATTSKEKESKKEESKATALNTNELNALGLGSFMLAAFFAGLVALLTPCVFPMIPMTVSFFTKQSKNKADGIFKASIYGISIVLIYTLLGLLVALLYGASFNNFISTHWIPNLFFFLLLFVFALSFLGMFEIVLPASWVNAVDRQADRGGYIGIFFMAFTLALVSFSCTAPIVGTILVQASSGEMLRPILGMVAFSTAVALPFSLFAAFPSLLQSLPKSGGWLNSVKVSLGLLELAFSLKFLSQIDLVYHLELLDRDIFIAIWIVIFAIWGFYLLGKIQFSHDSPLEKISALRAILAMAVFSFVVYMIPGLFGAPLSPLSGYLPPQTTQEFNLLNTQYENNNTTQSKLAGVKYQEYFKFPHRLEGFFDYEEGMAYAKKMNKPVFIDFTGHGCANCREMEAHVWAKKEVLKRLQNDYVLIALYVDDRHELPREEWFISTYDKKEKNTIGEKNADFQIVNFQNNAQPFYCLLDHEGKLLVPPKAYDLSAENFVQFLDNGLAAFQKKKKEKP